MEICEPISVIVTIFIWSIFVYGSVVQCSCRNVTCPSFKPCGELAKDKCECCFVGRNDQGQIFGDNNSVSVGGRERVPKCKYVEGNSEKTGFCESVVKHSARDGVCLDLNTGHAAKRIGESWINGCFKMTCEKDAKVHMRRPMCLQIGCGTTKSIASDCCRFCEREIARVVCGTHGMLLTIPKSIMSRKSFEKSSLTNERCTGFENRTHFYFVTSWNACGTKLEHLGSVYNYTNRVVVGRKGNSAIERTFLEFFCVRQQVIKIKQAFRIRQRVVETGVAMQMTSKGGKLYPKKRSLVVSHSEEKMYVAISAPIVKKFKLRMVLNWCVLVPSKKINREKDTKHHKLIEKGCIVNKRVSVRFRRKDVVWFSIQNLDLPFRKLYLHCNVIICPQSATKGRCARDCIRTRSKGGITA